MAGAIRAAKAANRTVIVELMTHGEGSGNCTSVFPTTAACGTARVYEFAEAMIRLGVDGVVGGHDGGNNLGGGRRRGGGGAGGPAGGAGAGGGAGPGRGAGPGGGGRV